MTNDELKSAFKSQSFVVWEGKKYFLQGILTQWINGRVVVSAILMDNATSGKTIYQVKPETLKET